MKFISLVRRWIDRDQPRSNRRPGTRNSATTATESLETRALLTISTLSVSIDATTGAEISNDPHISRDGRFAVFQSRADDLVSAGSDSNGFQDIFVRNLIDDTTTLISATPEGRAGNDDSWAPTISDNGRFVAFASFATDLAKSATITAGPNVYVHDRDTDEDGIYDEPGATTVTLLSHSGTDELMSGNGPSGGISLGSQWVNRPVISGNGGVVAYVSASTNLLDPDDGVTVLPGPNLYVTTTNGERTTLVSADVTNTTSGVLFGGGFANTPSLSFDGRYVAFFSNYDNLTADDIEGFRDVFVRDIAGAVTTRVSVNNEGRGGNMASREPVISRNGRHVVFVSRATNLVDGDTNGTDDTFVHDILAKRTSLISRTRDPASTSTSGNEPSPSTAGPLGGGYEISDNGRYVLFTSQATDLLDPAEGIADTNGTLDVFFFDRDADSDGAFDELGPGGTSTSLVSINADGTSTSNSIFTTGGSTAVSLSGDGRQAVFVSPGTDLIPGGTAGTGVYLRDLAAGSTSLVGLTGLPFALQAGVAEASLSSDPLQVIFTSFATDVDPSVADENVGLDVFRYTASTDLRFLQATADGNERLVIAYSVENLPADGPFEIGVYLSTDGTLDAAEDDLLDTITIDGSDLEVGERKIAFDIGGGEGEVALPGAGAPELDSDYQILFVVDHLNVQSEIDDDPFNEDNLGRFEGIYHPAGGPVFVHGRTGPSLRNDSVTITEVDASTLEVRLNKGLRTYDSADVTSIRFRGHEGNDSVVAGGTADLLLGGAGDDKIRGGAGDDTIDGGIGNDALFGEAGLDTIFDGMGDDTIDLGPDGGVIIATPGSDDIFLGLDDDSLLDFSSADNAIEIDLDAFNVIQTVDNDANTVELRGDFDSDFDFTGSAFDDLLFVRVRDGDRVLRGGPGNDRINIDAGGTSVTFDGTTLTSATGGAITLVDFEDINVFNFPPIIIDDSDGTGFSDTGFFDSNPAFPQGFNDGVKFSGPDSGNTATWTFSDLPPGQYSVSATWTSAPDRASDAPVTIFDGVAGGTIAAQLKANQEIAPNDFEDAGVSWQRLANVTIAESTLTVQIADSGADEFVVADAIRILPIGPSAVIIDDGDPGFVNGTGTRVEGVGQFGDREVIPPGAANNVATWTFSDLADGLYQVSTTWSPDAGAATDASFTGKTADGSFTTSVNQQLAPDDLLIDHVPWEELGRIRVSDGARLDVILNADESLNVLADAVRIERVQEVMLFDHTEDILIGSGDTIDFGSLALDPITGEAIGTTTVIIRNDGSARAPSTADILNPGNSFTIGTPLPDSIPPGGRAEIELEFTGSSLGSFGSVFDIRDLFGVNLTATVVDDDVPPSVQITSPLDGSALIEGSTIALQLDVNDDVQVREVVLLVNGETVTSELTAPFDFTLPSLNDSLTPESGEITFSAIALDAAGNSTTSAPVTISLLPAAPPEVILFPLQADADPFVDSFFEVHADVLNFREIAQVEFLVNGVVVDTANQEPYFGRISTLDANVSSTITVVTLDVFGTEHISEPLTLRPPGVGIGNVDGDNDFDANDAFLVHLTQLSGTDAQIDQSKGDSSLEAVQIRTIIENLGNLADVDGDRDFDANDSFLIQLVQLSGSNAQIDQLKGSSSLTATQIRARIQSLGSQATVRVRDSANFEKAAATTAAHVQQRISSMNMSPDIDASIVAHNERELFDAWVAEHTPAMLVPSDFAFPESIGEFASEAFRQWIDAI